MSVTKTELVIVPSATLSCSTTRTVRSPRVASYIWNPMSPWYASATIVVRASRGNAPLLRNLSRPSIAMDPAVKRKVDALWQQISRK